MLKMIFKIVGKISPVYLQKRLKLSSEIHSRTTRSALSKKIFIKKINTKLEAKPLTTKAASVWNLWIDLHGMSTTLYCRRLLSAETRTSQLYAKGILFVHFILFVEHRQFIL